MGHNYLHNLRLQFACCHSLVAFSAEASDAIMASARRRENGSALQPTWLEGTALGQQLPLSSELRFWSRARRKSKKHLRARLRNPRRAFAEYLAAWYRCQPRTNKNRNMGRLLLPFLQVQYPFLFRAFAPNERMTLNHACPEVRTRAEGLLGRTPRSACAVSSGRCWCESSVARPSWLQ